MFESPRADIVSGWLHDLTKSYNVYLHSLTLVVIITFILWVTEWCLIRRQRRNNAREALIEVDGDLDDSGAPPIAVANRRGKFQLLTSNTLFSRLHFLPLEFHLHQIERVDNDVRHRHNVN